MQTLNGLTGKPLTAPARRAAPADTASLLAAAMRLSEVANQLIKANAEGEIAGEVKEARAEAAELRRELAAEKQTRLAIQAQLDEVRQELADAIKASTSALTKTMEQCTATLVRMELAEQRRDAAEPADDDQPQIDAIAALATTVKELATSQKTGLGQLGGMVMALAKSIDNMPEVPSELEFTHHRDGAGNILKTTAKAKRKS